MNIDIRELTEKLRETSKPFLKYGIAVKAEVFDTGEILIRREMGNVPEDELIKLNRAMMKLEDELNDCEYC